MIFTLVKNIHVKTKKHHSCDRIYLLYTACKQQIAIIKGTTT